MEKEMVSTFMEITACESQAYAVQHLGSCRWNLDEAINFYFNPGGGGGAGPSGVSAQIPSEAEAAMKEEEDNGGGDDDVRAPIPAYYGDRIAHALDAPFVGEAPYPAPVSAFPVQAALGEIQATWRGEEAEPGYGGQAGAERVDAGSGKSHDEAAAEQEDNINNNEDDGRMVTDDEDDEDNERSDDDDMSYNDSSDEIDDYGLEMDEDDDAYYAEDDGAEGQEPRPAAARRQQQQKSSLEDMYKLPEDLMCGESFHYAKVRAAREDRFLLVNLQAPDFQSALYNRDMWSDEQVRGVVKESLVLFLAQKTSTSRYGLGDECSMVCTFYRLEDDQLPAVLVLDPITGMLLEKWSGPMTPEEFVKFVDEYTRSKPSTMSKPKQFVKSTSAPAAAAAVEQEPAAPPEIPKPAAEAGEQQLADKSAAPAPEAGSEAGEPAPAPEAEPPAEMVEDDDDDEPMEGEKMYRLRIRFPDGTMVAKEFGCKRRVASLFAFCRTTVRGGGAAEQKVIRIVRFAGGRFEAVQGDGGVTFEDLDLNCATVSVVFDS